MSAPLEIQLSPRNSSADQDDDDNWESAAYQSGFDYDSMEVEPGETFSISPKLQATVNCDETPYVLRRKDHFGHTEERRGESLIALKPGHYIFHDDGLTIEQQ